MKKNKNPEIEPSIFRQIFIAQVKKDQQRFTKNKLLLISKHNRIKYDRIFQGLIHELESHKIANGFLATNRRAYLKIRNELYIKSLYPYLISICVILLITLLLIVFV